MYNKENALKVNTYSNLPQNTKEHIQKDRNIQKK